jgi:hypothetical protein
MIEQLKGQNPRLKFTIEPSAGHWILTGQRIRVMSCTTGSWSMTKAPRDSIKHKLTCRAAKIAAISLNALNGINSCFVV